MKKYDFKLIFKLAENVDPAIYVDDLYEAGCDDATLGVGRIGYIAFDFTREGESFHHAMFSAIDNIRKVLPNAALIRHEKSN